MTAIDPDADSLTEARKRAAEIGLNVKFMDPGDIRHAASSGPFDVVCYNFSLHYIFENFKESLDAIQAAIKPGGLLIGITPERARAELLTNGGVFTDPLGNTLEIRGDRLWVSLTDGPFYADGPKSEPLLDAALITDELTARGFTRITWEPMIPAPNWHVSDLYSTFVFRKNS